MTRVLDLDQPCAQRTKPPPSRRPLRIAVVGAGVAGLTAARILDDHGHDVVVLDKGRGPGGRSSVRRTPGHDFDHGAQYFTVRDERFRGCVDSWLDEGVVAPWEPRLAVFGDRPGGRAGGAPRRYVGVPGMNAPALRLARGLEIRSGVRAERLVGNAAGWRVEDGNGDVLATAEVVAVATPPAQAAPLLAASTELADRAAAAVMRPCWAAMLGFAAPLPVDFDAAFVNEGPLAWVARDSDKPGRRGGESWVLHAAPDWTRENLERDPAEVAELLLADFAARCAGGSVPGPEHAAAHRWRFALPDPALETSCLYDPARRLGAAGDWCGASRIEGAFLSGRALAERILQDAADGAVGLEDGP